MNIIADLDVLRARFLSQWDKNSVLTLTEEQPQPTLDTTKPYVRFSIRPEDVVRRTLGDTAIFDGYGHIWFQVFYPKGQGTKAAYIFANTFANIFREWKSPDSAITCKRENYISTPSGKANPEYFTVSVFIPYHSHRRY